MKLLWTPKRKAKKILDARMTQIYKKVEADIELTPEEAELVLQTVDIDGSINWDAVKVVTGAGISLLGLYYITKKEETDIVSQKGFSIWQKMLGH